jgi:hypothetical protein
MPDTDGWKPGGSFSDLFAALSEPFKPYEVKVLDVKGRKPVQYITARVAMNRLDSVLGAAARRSPSRTRAATPGWRTREMTRSPAIATGSSVPV